MSTRSNIIRENLDGSFDSIYCHSDGYPSHNGTILLEHYGDPAKVDQLLSLGDLSLLGAEIGEQHSFRDRSKDVCIFYGRDRGETGIDALHLADAEELQKMLDESWSEWVYVFRVADGKWYFTNNPSPTWFKLCGRKQRSTAELTLETIQKAEEE